MCIRAGWDLGDFGAEVELRGAREVSNLNSLLMAEYLKWNCGTHLEVESELSDRIGMCTAPVGPRLVHARMEVITVFYVRLQRALSHR